RWAQGHRRGARRRFRADDAANVHRAPAASELGLGELEPTQTVGDRATRDLYSAQRRPRTGGARRLRTGGMGQRFPTIVAAWRRAWTRVIPFFAFPPEIRRVIYTTNALESVHARLRKIIKTRGHFPNDEAATKLIWLALRNITATWERAAPSWR